MKKLSVLALAMLVLSGCSGDDEANKDPQKTEMPSTSSDGDVSTTDSQAGNANITKLPKTGITKCGDFADNIDHFNNHNNNLDCSLTTDSDGDPIPAKQDGHVQAGETMAYETITYSNNTSGSSVTETCIKDKVTGLIWEQKTDDDGLRDKDNTYTWYKPDDKTNDSFVKYDRSGTQNGGSCTGSACDTHAYIQALNASNYCGYSDWRMPTRMELVTIVDYGRINPAINSVFNNTQSYYYWSGSSHAGNHKFARAVNFDIGSFNNNTKYHIGFENNKMKDNVAHVRALRASQ